MTIAAGFVASDGVLLCADTLYTDGITKEYHDKVFTWTGNRAALVLAMWGHASNGRMAVDESIEAVSNIKKGASISAIVGKIRPVIKRIYEQYVDSRPSDERNQYGFGVLAAIANNIERPALFCSYGPSLSTVDEFECQGIGRALGRYIIELGFQKSMTVDDVAVLAIQSLAAAKERVDGIGGESQFAVVKTRSAAASVSFVVPHDVNRAEAMVLRYQKEAAALLMNIGNLGVSDEHFKHHMARFNKEVADLRKEWQRDAAPWINLLESLHKMHESPEHGDDIID